MKLFGTDPATPEGARKAVRAAGIAGFVSVAITVAVVLFVRYSQEDPFFGGLVSLWSLVDVVIMALLAFGTLRENRFAAAGLLGYFVLNQFIARVLSGQVDGVLLTLVFVLLFVQGARGAYTLHRLGEDDPLATQVDAIAEADRV